MIYIMLEFKKIKHKNIDSCANHDPPKYKTSKNS